MNTRVIVVGAGPVGLMLAGELKLGGADVVLYDKLPAPSGESRALGFTRRVAEVLDQRGLLPRIGEFRNGQNTHFGGIGIDLSTLDENHRGVLGLPQSRTEAALAGWLEDLGVETRRGYEAVDFREDENGVTVVFGGPEGPHEDTAAYLVGCDGGYSTVRSVAGIEAPGWESERGVYMADITGVDLNLRPTGQHLPGGNMILAVPLGDGYFRILIHDKSLPAYPDNASLTYQDVADAWQRLTGESIHGGSARWMVALSNGAGLAADYRRGRVLLAGDAAHSTPPLAGWGLATGVQDAVNLGWKLAAVVTGRAPETLLDTYHTERHPLGQQLLRNSHAASTLMLGDDELDPLRNVLRELMTHKDVATHFAGMISGLGVRYDVGAGGHPQLGLRLSPELELELADGTRTRVAELLHAGRGVFISTDGSSEADLPTGWSDRVDTVTGTWIRKDDDSRPALDAVLIRPDGHIAWAAPDAGDLPEALDRWFGPVKATVNA